MKVLVTGGSGFLGSHVAEYLIKKKHKVVILDNLSGGSRENIPKGAIFYKGDICDKSKVEILFSKEKFDYVYHLAAYAAEGLSHFIRRYNYKNNVLGSINLINAAINHNVKHFVFTSSMAVYGSGKVPFCETQEPRPEDPYGIAKLAVEQDLQAASALFGMKYTIFRPHNIYGPRQNINDKYRNVIGIFIKQALQRNPVTVFGDGFQTRAFSYIDDVAPYIAKSPFVEEAKNEIINIGGDDVPYNIEMLIAALNKCLSRPVKVVYLPKRHEVQAAYCDHSKFKRTFVSDPLKNNFTSLETGLARMYLWAKTQKLGKTRKMKPEVMKNLPQSWK